MESRTLKDAIQTIKMFSSYINDEHLSTMKLFVTGLYNIENDVIELMLKEIKVPE